MAKSSIGTRQRYRPGRRSVDDREAQAFCMKVPFRRVYPSGREALEMVPVIGLTFNEGQNDHPGYQSVPTMLSRPLRCRMTPESCGSLRGVMKRQRPGAHFLAAQCHQDMRCGAITSLHWHSRKDEHRAVVVLKGNITVNGTTPVSEAQLWWCY